jgi:hypothetical protein
MNNGNPTGEVRPMIDREPPKAAETRGASVRTRFCETSGGWFGPSEPCPSLWNGALSAFRSRQLGNLGLLEIPAVLHALEARMGGTVGWEEDGEEEAVH